MDAAAIHPEPAASDLLLEHCFALDDDRRCPTAFARLEALIGADLAHRLVYALVGSR